MCSETTIDDVVTSEVTISGLEVTIPIPNDSLGCDKELKLLKSDRTAVWKSLHTWNSDTGVLTVTKPGTYYYTF